MKKKFCLVIIGLCVACVSKPIVPDDIMSKDEMISYLIDIHILEGETSRLKIPRDSSQLLYRYFEDKLKSKHNVTDSLYLKSLTFYYSNPKLMEEIYTAVLDSLSLYERMSEGNEN